MDELKDHDNTRDDIPACDDELVEFDVPTDFGPLPAPATADAGLRDDEPPVDPAPTTLEVRRRAGVAALVGVLAGAVASAYLARAVDTGATLDWVVCALMAIVAMAHLTALLDARTPLLVADEQGVRLRLGRSWVGLTWGSLRRVEVTERHGLRDGRLVLMPRNAQRVLEEAEAGARRSARLSRRLYGAPFAVPLSLASRVVGADGRGAGVETALRSLAGGRAKVVAGPIEEPVDEAVVLDDGSSTAPGGRRWTHPGPAVAHAIGVVAARLRWRPDVAAPGEVVTPEPVVASATPSPLRHLVPGRRTEVSRDLPTDWIAGANALKADVDEGDMEATHGLPELDALRRPGSVELEVEGWGSYGERVRPIAVPGEALETIVIDDFAIEPAEEPVIGPEFAAARTRLGLSVDELADRTRIRPHVIESIEVDDFVPCGGDFYARGHIRTLARILGVDAAPLLASYDERYADAPVEPTAGLRGRARPPRRHPRDPRRPELVGAGRRRDGPGAGLVDRPPGDGRPRRPARPARAQRLRRPQPPECPGGARRPRGPLGTRRRCPGDRPRRHRVGRLHRRPRLRRHQDPLGLPTRPRPGHRRLRHRLRRRRRPRRPRQGRLPWFRDVRGAVTPGTSVSGGE